MLRSHRCWALLLCAAAAGLVLLAPPQPALSQDAQAGVEVQARGPVHEAFASLTGDPVPAPLVSKQPPAPLDELPPDERPEGDVIWISGYWAWDEDRSDFIWVSGLWRTVPPGKQWVAGYWRESGNDGWQWVAGFWASTKEENVTYLPTPPELPNVAPPPKPPSEDSFYVPGLWVWNGNGYAWRAGYYARVQPGWVWVSDHYRWTPSGHVFIAGYWDLAVSKRGILYAPVYVSPAVRVSYVYTPCYAVRDTVIVDSLFVRPTTCHYYFGDYYEVKYRERGFQSSVVYSQTRYDSIIVYERYERRRDPTWVNVQVTLYNDRVAGRAPVPPRVVQQNVIQQNVVQQNVIQQNVVNNNTTVINNNNTVNNNTTNNTVNNRNVNNNLSMVAPTKTVVAQNKNVNLVKVDETTRTQAKQQAQAVQAVSVQRGKTEVTPPPSAGQVRTAALSTPKVQPVKQGMVAPTVPAVSQTAVKVPAANNAAVKTPNNVTNPAVKAPVAQTPNAAANNAAVKTPPNNAAVKTPANATNPAVKAPVAQTPNAAANNAAVKTPANLTNPAVKSPTSPAINPAVKTPGPTNATNPAPKSPAVTPTTPRPTNQPQTPITRPVQQPTTTQPTPRPQPTPTATQPKQPQPKQPQPQPTRRPPPKDKDKDKK